MSDAEKMGMWPAGTRSTYDICYGSGFTGKPWIQELFEMLNETPWIVSCTISEYFEQYKQYPLRVAYFKTESYDKMGVWALPSDERRGIEKLKREIRYKTAPLEIQKISMFLKGAHWRGFIAKYVESNVLHKKMIFARSIFTKIQKNYSSYFTKYDELYRAYDLILQAQCNDVYWHGQFGGIYYRFMREYSHACIINAISIFENTFKKNLKQNLFQNVTFTPILLNGTQDCLLNSSKVMMFISLSDGGSIFSLDDKDTNFNFLNVFTRIIESYHPIEGIPEKGIVSDLYSRRSFRDHFFSKKPNIMDFFTSEIKFESLFYTSPYEMLTYNQKNTSITLRCTSTLKERVLDVEKSYKVIGSIKKVIVEYVIMNMSDDNISCYFIPEMNFILPGNDKKNRYQINNSDLREYDEKEMYAFDNVSSLKLINSELNRGIQLNLLSSLATVEMFTILSHESSESLEYSNYQGHCFLPFFEIMLESLGKQHIILELELI